MTARLSNSDRGSVIPLILGLFLVAIVLVAGSVAAGDAFVQQSALQDTCDGAAVAAASSADLNDGRQTTGNSGDFLDLSGVQAAVDQYQSRDPGRSSVTMVATVGSDGQTVTVQCRETSSIAFGAWFGFGSGIVHNVTSTARSPLRTN